MLHFPVSFKCFRQISFLLRSSSVAFKYLPASSSYDTDERHSTMDLAASGLNARYTGKGVGGRGSFVISRAHPIPCLEGYVNVMFSRCFHAMFSRSPLRRRGC